MNTTEALVRRLSVVCLAEGVVSSMRDTLDGPEGSEACGFLAGQMTGSRLIVTTARPTENIYESIGAFAITQLALAAILDEVGSSGPIGIYHLHQGPPHLSWKDRRNVMLQPFFWVIVGRPDSSIISEAAPLRFKGFKPGASGIVRIRVRVEEPAS